MSSLLTSQGVVFATAMAVSAGTMILLAAFRLQKSQEFSFNSIPHHPPRSCISTDGKKKEKKKKKKRVKFAEDVVEPSGNSEEYRKLHHFNNNNFRHGNEDEAFSSSANSDSNTLKKSGKVQEMPANRVALYKAMLKGRVINRVTYSY